MRVIIAGSRGITEYGIVALAVALSGFEVTEVVSGRARGVDLLGERWAELNGVPVAYFPVTPAMWETEGKRAGHNRSHRMSQYADALVAVWDGRSKGTWSMIGIARAALHPVYVHDVRGINGN